MAAQGRKNVHGKAGVRFKAGYTASKNKSMLRNVVTDLVKYGQVQVTSGVVKELKSLGDKMITLAKDGSLAARRQAAAILRDEESLKKLFDELGKKYATRNGGYTRALKLGNRRGDDAEVVLVSYVD
ncbi:MAG: 50S ribosomal protein L17 [Candidatus Enteromonas sp.]|jgi:large subunit ribosomal protein L17|nr:50S ribosomal protein L17 [Bacilli bacterium]MEE3298708.1 50S ribosomal protein L17 [Candidatus Enteromonas sp.]MBQ1879258.1 50S ribosomal protein L17 [Bacilli bacterium]MBQ2052520.1 50S ribosomal protein L17 [Bacilli bacterium]MBQ4182075.1 50S ribosomal protein L17 [Bacilli bacterium]